MFTNKEKVPCENNILALDTASHKTGYAIYKDNKIVDSGVWNLKCDKRFDDLYTHIKKVIKEYAIDTIIAEDVFKKENKKNAFEVLCECRGIVELCSQKFNIKNNSFLDPIRVKYEIWGYNPKRWESHKKIDRKKQKEIMIKAISQLGYIRPDSKLDDEADAIGLLIAYLKIWGYSLPEYNS